MSTTTISPVHDESSNVIELRPRHGDEEPPATPKPISRDELADGDVPLMDLLEAVLFVSPTPLPVDSLAMATGATADEVEETLLEMMGDWCEASSGIVLERVAGGWAFRTADRAREALARLFSPQADTRLSPSALETMSIVAYLQPISRPDVARIRGVSVDAAMSNLLERGFVEEAGRNATGAVLFRTTALFERAFGLSSVKNLPEIDGFAPGPEEVDRLRSQLEVMASARVD